MLRDIAERNQYWLFFHLQRMIQIYQTIVST